jgi:hypothetical protein
MFWALARVSFRAAKIVSCNKNFFFIVYDQNYHNCSTLHDQTFQMSHVPSACRAVPSCESVLKTPKYTAKKLRLTTIFHH